MSVRRSAGGAGSKPFSRSLARMNWSMGLRAQFKTSEVLRLRKSRAAGGTGLVTGLSDHQVPAASAPALDGALSALTGLHPGSKGNSSNSTPAARQAISIFSHCFRFLDFYHKMG